MHRARGVAVVFLLGLIALVPAAIAAGPTVTYSIRAGAVAGDNNWWRSNVTVDISVQDATDTTCPIVKTFQASSDALDCTATDGTATTSFHLQFQIDKDAPVVTGSSASRAPNAADWYNAAVTVTFTGSDATSGIASCTQTNYSGPDSGAANVPGTCRDRAGWVSPASTFPLKYDATAPSVNGTPARGTDRNGWYNHSVGISFSATDGTSGVATGSCTSSNYAGPDSGGASVAGSCRDIAGNTGNAAFLVKYDATAPLVTANGARGPDSNGWYNHALSVGFSGSDATSGGVTCDAAKNYGGPDSSSTSVSGACTDAAGNTGSGALAFKYDATSPAVTAATSRAPDQNGWYNHSLSVSYSGTDNLSGGVSCIAPKSYSGPDGANVAVPGTCNDAAGNTGTGAATIGYDATGPTVTPTPSRAPDSNGWFNHSLSVSFVGTDPVSGVASCDAAKAYAGPDSSSASISGNCSDRAGNTGSGALPVKYDATAPTISNVAPQRQPDQSGWYNHALTITFSSSDATSGIAGTCSSVSYSGPDSASASAPISCRDQAGNPSAPLSFSGFKYDATAPVVAAAPDRAPNANGWYNAPVTVTFRDTSAAVAPVTCVSPKTYSGGDSATANLPGTCTDAAGNTGTGAATFGYDATPPTVTNPAPDRAPDKNGWYNHPLTLTFSSSDATSGIAGTCSSVAYSGPDSAAGSAPIVCRDRAGNANAPLAYALEYDATAPSVVASPDRGPNVNGWYNSPVTVTFGDGSQSVSPVTCDAPKTYAGDSASANVPGSCTDAAGNTALGAATFGYDATPPTATGLSPDRTPDSNGWYNRPLTVSFSGSDGTSGIESCSSARYDGPDSAGASVSGTCTDRAGNTVSAGSYGFQYDATGPSVRPSPSRAPDSNGWYSHAVSVGFAGSDDASGINSCTAASYGGPDTASASVGGSCTDKAGNVGSAAFGLKYDATAPSVTAKPARDADGNGWYSHPIQIGFSAADALSGVDSCTSATYSGPDTAGADVSGSCRDAAGNSASRSFTVRYDATPPTLGNLAVVGLDRSTRLSWKASADATITVTRAGPKGGPTRRYSGNASAFVDKGLLNGTRYRYSVTARDPAGNEVSKSIAAVPLALFAPAQGARISSPPLLEWAAVRGADYYNLQVMHDGKVLSAWPLKPRFQLTRRWRFGGKLHVLAPGVYRWYVWPGFGARSKVNYGPRIGGSFFVVVK